MLQIIGIWARFCLVALAGCLCAFALAGWAITGSIDFAPAWASWLLWMVWAHPVSRAVTLVSIVLEFWNRLVLREV